MGETCSPVPRQFQGIPSALAWDLGGSSELWLLCPSQGERHLHLPMVTWQQKARQQVTVSSFLEEIRKAKVSCWEGDDGRHCYWGHHPGGTKGVSLPDAGASTNSLSQGAGPCSLLHPNHSLQLCGCRPRRIADGSIGGQCPLMDSRPKPPSIFAEPLSLPEARERAGGDQGPSCICWTKAQGAGQGCTPARGCNQ